MAKRRRKMAKSTSQSTAAVAATTAPPQNKDSVPAGTAVVEDSSASSTAAQCVAPVIKKGVEKEGGCMVNGTDYTGAEAKTPVVRFLFKFWVRTSKSFL